MRRPLVMLGAWLVLQCWAPSVEARTLPIDGSSSQAFQSDLFTGAATYSVPIVVPPGINGMAPALAFTYNSSNGNGWLGVGWSLQVGNIARIPRKPGRFVLTFPGARTAELVAVAVDASGIGEYRTRIESFLKITYSGQSWTVIDKTGLRHVFGSTTAARTGPAPSAGAGTVQWALDQVIDPSGNTILYRYLRDNGELYLSRIDYTAAGGVSPRRAVLFHYELRPDIEYRPGGPFNSIVYFRLRTVEVVADVTTGQRAGAWRLGYAQSANSSRSLLTSITRYGSDVQVDGSGNVTGGSSLPPTTFAYDTSPGVVVNEQHTTDVFPALHQLNDGHEKVVTGDFNGDGRTDIAYSRSQWGVWRMSLATGSGFTNVQWPLPPGVLAIHNLASGNEAVVTGDFNGDGRTDIAHASKDWGGWEVFLSTGSGFTVQWWSVAPAKAIHDLALGIEAVLVGDFNGDGKTDIAHAATDWTGWELFLSTGSGFAVQWWSVAPAKALHNFAGGNETVLVGDFNGDGKADIAHAAAQWPLWEMLLSTGAGFTVEQWSVAPGQWAIHNLADGNEAVITGDFNGDGKTDIAHARMQWNGWEVFLSNGTGIDTRWWSVAPAQWAIHDLADGNEAVVTGDFQR